MEIACDLNRRGDHEGARWRPMALDSCELSFRASLCKHRQHLGWKRACRRDLDRSGTAALLSSPRSGRVFNRHPPPPNIYRSKISITILCHGTEHVYWPYGSTASVTGLKCHTVNKNTAPSPSLRQSRRASLQRKRVCVSCLRVCKRMILTAKMYYEKYEFCLAMFILFMICRRFTDV